MPDGKFGIHPEAIRAIVHQPIETIGMTIDDVEDLKMKFYNVVQRALDNYQLSK